MGKRGRKPKLTDVQVEEVKASLEPGKLLAARYGLSTGRIVQIRGRGVCLKRAVAEGRPYFQRIRVA